MAAERIASVSGGGPKARYAEICMLMVAPNVAVGLCSPSYHGHSKIPLRFFCNRHYAIVIAAHFRVSSRNDAGSAKIGKPRCAAPDRTESLVCLSIDYLATSCKRAAIPGYMCVCISLAGIFVTEKYCIFTLRVTRLPVRGRGEGRRGKSPRHKFSSAPRGGGWGDENNSHSPLERQGQDNRERGMRKTAGLEIENELSLSLSLCFLYTFFFRRESERDPRKSAVTRTLEFIRNHVPHLRIPSYDLRFAIIALNIIAADNATFMKLLLSFPLLSLLFHKRKSEEERSRMEIP